MFDLVLPIEVHCHEYTQIAEGLIWAEKLGWLALDPDLIRQFMVSVLWYACVAAPLRILAAVIHAGDFCFASRDDQVCPISKLGELGGLHAKVLRGSCDANEIICKGSAADMMDFGWGGLDLWEW